MKVREMRIENASNPNVGLRYDVPGHQHEEHNVVCNGVWRRHKEKWWVSQLAERLNAVHTTDDAGEIEHIPTDGRTKTGSSAAEAAQTRAGRQTTYLRPLDGPTSTGR